MSTVRPDNLKAALDAKLAAAMSQLVDLREAEQARVAHLNPREIVRSFLLYARGVCAIVETFGKSQAGHLQFNAWYGQWSQELSGVDRALWARLRDNRVEQGHGQDPALLALDSAVAARPSAGSEMCTGWLQLVQRLAADFLRDYARFLPET